MIENKNFLNISPVPNSAFEASEAIRISIAEWTIAINNLYRNGFGIIIARTFFSDVVLDQFLVKKSKNFSFKTEKLDCLHGESYRLNFNFNPKFTVWMRRLVQEVFQNSKLFRDPFWVINVASFKLLGKRRFERGTRILWKGKLVLTDGLHGNIVSMHLRKTQELFDNQYRKMGDYVDYFESKQGAIFYVEDNKSLVEPEVSNALDNLAKGNKNE